MKGLIKRIGAILVASLAVYMGFSMLLNRNYAKEQQASGSGAKLMHDGGWIDIEKLKSQTTVGKVVEDELFFLLTGVDVNEGESHDNVRTDTMMLMKVNFSAGTIDLISLPRDSYVEIDGRMTKLNHAHAYGGIDLTISTIRKWLDIDLDYYIEVDYHAVQSIVDALGGVEYTIPDNGIKYDYYVGKTRHELKTGKQVLNGEQALGYLRFRQGYADGDLGRVKAQQDFMKALAKQLLTSNGVTKLMSVLKTYFNDVRTNIGWQDMLGFASNLGALKGKEIVTHTLPGEPIMVDGVSYLQVDEVKAAEIIRSVLPNYVMLRFDGQPQSEAGESDATPQRELPASDGN